MVSMRNDFEPSTSRPMNARRRSGPLPKSAVAAFLAVLRDAPRAGQGAVGLVLDDVTRASRVFPMATQETGA